MSFTSPYAEDEPKYLEIVVLQWLPKLRVDFSNLILNLRVRIYKFTVNRADSHGNMN